jgi:hypothetical protein
MPEQQFCEDIKGVRVCSNVPLNKAIKAPARYKIVIEFKLPFLNYISWVQIRQTLSPINLANELSKALGYKVQIRDYKVYIIDDRRLGIEFTASSPPVAIAIAVILGLLAFTTWLILQILVTVKELIETPAGTIFLAGISIAIAAGVGYLIYRAVRKK